MIKTRECYDSRLCCFQIKSRKKDRPDICSALESTYEGDTCPFAKGEINNPSYFTLELRRQKKAAEEAARKERMIHVER